MADPLLWLRMASIVAIALAYMLFDVFNRRTVPSLYVYGTLVYGAVLTLAYMNVYLVAESSLVAVAVLALGYVVYRIGQLGLADVIELAALSLMLPVQGMPFAALVPQYSLPFVLSVIVNAGIASLVIAPIYYVPRAFRKLGKRINTMLSRTDVTKAAVVTAAYAGFLAFLVFATRIGTAGIALVIVMMAGSSMMLFFEKPMTEAMVDRVTFRGMEDGDIIATNLMSSNEIAAAKKRVPGFERLVTPKLISTMRRRHFATRLPVYKNAMPFALSIFVGAAAALLFGNLILYILPL